MQTPINELAFNTIEWLDLCWFFFFHFCLLIKSVVGFAEVNLIDAVARALLKNDYFNSCASLSIRFKIETCSGVNNNTVAVIYNRRKRRRLSARHIIIENVRQIRVHRMTGIFQTNTTDVKSKRMSQLNNNHCQYIDIQYCLYLLSPFLFCWCSFPVLGNPTHFQCFNISGWHRVCLISHQFPQHNFILTRCSVH